MPSAPRSVHRFSRINDGRVRLAAYHAWRILQGNRGAPRGQSQATRWDKRLVRCTQVGRVGSWRFSAHHLFGSIALGLAVRPSTDGGLQRPR
eukprot:scaffold170281_cov29-Tisochrysis_lutea.AAC.9